MTNRRDFIRQISAGAALACSPGMLLAKKRAEDPKIWACLLHLSFNMWEEFISPHRPFRGFRPDIELSELLWNDAIRKMPENGVNMVLIDVGDAVKLDSHPEIAVRGAWTTTRLRNELDKIRSLGIEPVPKLNFSGGHDTWLREYARMVSTDKYYQVCSEIIAEVSDLFGKPRLFHLGMDEESASHQGHQKYILIRQGNAWWKDFYFLVEQVEKSNSRAWIWPDYMLWSHPDEFFRKMPKTVVQSNWYYGESFELNPPGGKTNTYVKAYLDLEEHGYDQIPTGSYHADNAKSIGNTVHFSKKNITSGHLMGFMQSFWKPTIEENRERILKGIELLGAAKAGYKRMR